MNAMELLLSQPWVERLGWTLIHFLWQGALAAGFYAGARSWILRASGANARYVLACATLAVLVALPVVTFTSMQPAGPVPLSGPIGGSVITASSSTAAATAAQPRAEGDTIWDERLLALVVVVWLFGAVAFWVRLAGGWIIASGLRRKSVRRAPAEWLTVLDKLKVGVS